MERSAQASGTNQTNTKSPPCAQARLPKNEERQKYCLMEGIRAIGLSQEYCLLERIRLIGLVIPFTRAGWSESVVVKCNPATGTGFTRSCKRQWLAQTCPIQVAENNQGTPLSHNGEVHTSLRHKPNQYKEPSLNSGTSPKNEERQEYCLLEWIRSMEIEIRLPERLEASP